MIQEPESFESLLNEALHSYSSVEPRPGLEQRINAHVAAHPLTLNRSRRKLSPLWLVAAASLVIVLAVIAISMHSTPRQQQAVARETPALINPIAETKEITITKQPVHRPQPRRVSHPAPLLEHGQPQLTESDRLLVQLASLNPQEARILPELQKSSEKQIITPPLEIHPLASNPIVIAPIAMNHDEHASF